MPRREPSGSCQRDWCYAWQARFVSEVAWHCYQEELGLPILFAGLGEALDDLQPFNPDLFIQGILDEQN
jgi:hypothetical protein